MKVRFVLLFIVLFLFNFSIVNAETVKLDRCIDGDTARFFIDGKSTSVRFLAIDTPETKHPTKGEEPFGKEASTYTCNALKKAKKIELEYDKNSDKTDKYNRHLAWIFIDGDLLQSQLIEKGLAKTAYLYGDYKYTKDLQKLEKQAQKDKVGMWGDYEEDYTEIIIGIALFILIIILFIFNQKFRNKTKKTINNKLNKELNNIIKRI